MIFCFNEAKGRLSDLPAGPVRATLGEDRASELSAMVCQSVTLYREV
jgi:hypothetical protein